MNFTIDSIGTINRVLGFELNTTYTSVSGILDAPFPLNLLGILKLKIASYELQTSNYDSSVKGNLNILATIPIEAGSFGLILYDNISNTQSVIKNPTLDGFDLKIFSDDNNLVNFNNIGWNISLLLSITKVKRERSKTNFKDIINPILNLIDNTKENKQPKTDNSKQSENEENIQENPEIQENQIFEDYGDSSLDLLLYNTHTYL